MSDEVASFKIELIDKNPPAKAAQPAAPQRPTGPVQAATPLGPAALKPLLAQAPWLKGHVGPIGASPAPSSTPAAAPTAAPAASTPAPAPSLPTARPRQYVYGPQVPAPPVRRQPVTAAPPAATNNYPAGPGVGRGIISAVKGAGGKIGAMTEAAGLEGAAAGGGAGGPIGAAVMMIAGAIGGALKDNAQLIGAGSVGEHGGGAVAASVALDAIKKLPGPLGKVVEGMEAVGEMADAAFRQLAKNIQHFGAVTANVVRGDFIEAAAQRLEKRAEEKGSTVWGKITGAATEDRLRAASLRAYQQAEAALNTKTEQLRQWSPEIISAQTSAAVQTMMERMGQARAVGGNLANVTLSKTAFQLAAERLAQRQTVKLANDADRALQRGNMAEAYQNYEKLGKLADTNAVLAQLMGDNSEEGIKQQKLLLLEVQRIRKEMEATKAMNAPKNLVQDLLADLKFLNPLPPKDEMMDNPNWAQQAMIGPLVIND